MASRRLYGILERLLVGLNHFRRGVQGWGTGEELYNRILLDRIRERIAQLPPGPMRIVDGGCGTGRFALELAGAGHRVTGIEIHRPSAEVARRAAAERGLPVEILEGELLSHLVRMPAEHFRVGLCLGVLYTCVRYREIVGEFVRVLERGGLFAATFRPPFYYITTMLRKGQYDKALFVSRNTEGVLRVSRVPCYYNWQTDAELDRLFDGHGLEPLLREPIGRFTGIHDDGLATVTDLDGLQPAGWEKVLELERGAPASAGGAGRYVLMIGRKR